MNIGEEKKEVTFEPVEIPGQPPPSVPVPAVPEPATPDRELEPVGV